MKLITYINMYIQYIINTCQPYLLSNNFYSANTLFLSILDEYGNIDLINRPVSYSMTNNKPTLCNMPPIAVEMCMHLI